MFENLKNENKEKKEKSKEVYVYKIIEKLESGEERVSFAWKTDNASFYDVIKDEATGDRKKIDVNLSVSNHSEDLEKLKYNLNFHKNITKPKNLEISIEDYEILLDVPSDVIRQIEDELNEDKKENVVSIRVLSLTEKEKENFQNE